MSQLFDIFDPYGDLERRSRMGLLRDEEGNRRRARVEDLLEEEEKSSMLRELAQRGASGLSAFGWLLDTPGSMVRGLLSEGPGKAMSALWETSDERVTGRELLRQYDLAGSEDNWSNFGGGLTTEILLDPLTYFSLGAAPLLGAVAKKASGKVAAKAGMLSGDLGLLAKKAVDKNLRGPGYGRMQLQRETPEAFLDILKKVDPGEAARLRNQFMDVAGDKADELLGQRMSGSHRIGFPGIGEFGVDLFTERYGNWITRKADQLGQAARATPLIGPALRGTQALVDGRVMGAVDEAKQWRSRGISEFDRLGRAEGDRWISENINDIAQEIGYDKWQNNAWRSQFSEAFGLAMENQKATTVWDSLPEDIRSLFTPGGSGEKLVERARSFQDDTLNRARELGVPLNETTLPFDIGYMSRQKTFPDTPRMADGYLPPRERAIDRGLELFGISAGEGARREYTQPFPRWVLNKMAQDKGLQESLRAMRGSDPLAVADSINAWLKREAPDYWQKTGGRGPFSYLLEKVDDLRSAEGQAAIKKGNELYGELADTLSSLPLNYADDGLPFYGDPLADFTRYVSGRSRVGRNAQALYGELAEMLQPDSLPRVPDFSSLSAREALEAFGLDAARELDDAGNILARSAAENQLAAAMGGIDPSELDRLRIPKDFVDEMLKRTQKARVAPEAQGLLKWIDQYTQAFKSLALLYPSRYSRDLYSGAFSAAMRGLYNPFDRYAALQAGRGNYKPLARRLGPGLLRSAAPGYEDLTADERVLKFLTGAGGERLTQNNILDDLGRQASNLSTPDFFPGSTGPYTQGLRESYRRQPNPIQLFRKKPDGGWEINPNFLLWSQRNRQGNPNWLLDLGDRAATLTDSTNRIGTYLNAVRKGNTPEAARGLADLTQVNYRPENFTSFERDVIKRAVPFYSFTKGIAPLVYQDLVERPAGLMGQSIRAINRAGEPAEGRFTPEYLRQSAAIPLDASVPLLGVDSPNISRFLSNIDLPYEQLLNFFSPGIGNTVTRQVFDSLMKSGQNLLGQTNPLLKGPLEFATNRQFYSGRELSDLYSTLEQTLGTPGRGLEQLAYNLPGGSRLMGLYRQAADDRIGLLEKFIKFLFNTGTGLRVQDVDQSNAERLAARSVLNELLGQSTGVDTYENLYIKPEDLLKLSPEEKQQYLLYRVLQSEASRKARERKKAEQDPLAMFNL